MDLRAYRYSVRIVWGWVIFVTAGVIFDWPWLDLGHAPVEKVERLHGLPVAKVLAEFGEPTYSYEFPMKERAGEFSIELWNFYPPDDPTVADVRIQELTWKHWGYSVAVWFHQVDGEWVALDSCRWQKGVEF